MNVLFFTIVVLALMDSRALQAEGPRDSTAPFVLPSQGQGEVAVFNRCNQNVIDELVDWAGNMLTIANVANCDTGTSLKSGTCKVAGVPVDSSCRSSMAAVAGALRNIRGDNGLGCLNKVNGLLAESLLNVLNQGQFKVCCDACSGAVSEGPRSCAGTDYNLQGTGGTITLNVVSLENPFAGAHCSGRYQGKGLEANLFHELLHAAGLNGFRGHPSTMLDHPVTGHSLEERDVLADPVYGCQNFCYGSDAFSNSSTCLSCSLGEPVQEGKALETAKWDYLNNRLLNAWDRIEASDSTIPYSCREQWDKGQGERGRRISRATRVINQIKEQSEAIDKCLIDFESRFRISKMLGDELEGCREPFRLLQQKCRDFARAVTYKKKNEGTPYCSHNLYSIELEPVLAICRNSVRNLQGKIGASIRFADDKQNFNCNSWFPGVYACPEVQVSGVNTPLTSDRCLQGQTSP